MAYSDLTPEQRRILEEDNAKPVGNNASLEELFQSVSKILIKKGGVYDNKALGQTINLVLESKSDISELMNALKIEVPKEVLYCMCPGSYAIELYENLKLKATIGLHHGKAIRYVGWKGDADLKDGLALLYWLASKGYDEPLTDFRKDQT